MLFNAIIIIIIIKHRFFFVVSVDFLCECVSYSMLEVCISKCAQGVHVSTTLFIGFIFLVSVSFFHNVLVVSLYSCT